jgi:hypothetical protein
VNDAKIINKLPRYETSNIWSGFNTFIDIVTMKNNIVFDNDTLLTEKMVLFLKNINSDV